jgi:hypothetical protein
MKSFTTGLTVRFFSVTSATDIGFIPRSTGKAFNDHGAALYLSTESGSAVR